jgi:KUP system potassium uptake protein
VLSLIVYALVIVISIKYIAIVMRADNQGEGASWPDRAPAVRPSVTRFQMSVLVGLGIFGAALLYGDGMITPAISVLGAVEGLQVRRRFSNRTSYRYRSSFLSAVRRSSSMGRTGRRLVRSDHAALVHHDRRLGVVWIVRDPRVSGAQPVHALRYFDAHGFAGIAVLGAVFWR